MRKFNLLFSLFLLVFLNAKADIDPNHPKPQNISLLKNQNSIKLQWSKPNIVEQILVNENFESGIPSNWIIVDADGDNEKWELHPFTAAHSGVNSIASYSWLNGNTLHPNNWIIMPAITLNDTFDLNYWITGTSLSYSNEHYQVRVSETNSNISSFTNVIKDETLPDDDNSWKERTISLAQFTGKTIYIAFVHNNSSDLFAVKVDDVTISKTAKKNSPALLGYNVYRKNETQQNYIKINTALLDTTFFFDTLAVDGYYSYQIKAVYNDLTENPDKDYINLHFINWYPIPENPIAEDFQGNIKISWGEVTDNPKFLLNENFDNNKMPLFWLNNDYDQDGNSWELHPFTNAHSGSYSMASYSWFNGDTLFPNNWIISPLIDTKKYTNLNYWVSAVSKNYAFEKYSIYISYGSTDTNDFVKLFEEVLPADTAYWINKNIDLSAYNDTLLRIAFVHKGISGVFALKIDDIQLQSQNKLVGYNVYRYNSNSALWNKINSNIIEDLFFVDNEYTDTIRNKYVVTAFFEDNVESYFSKEATINVKIIENKENVRKYSIFPNPASDFIKIKSLNNEFFNVDVYNANGIKVKSSIFNSNFNTISTENLNNGLYLLKIWNHNHCENIKIVVKH